MGKMGKAKDLVEVPAYLSSAAAKHALGIHRGPLPKESIDGAVADIEHVETIDSITLEKVKRTPTQTLRRHWTRFWCCYIFWSIIFLAIFLPIFFLVIIPAVAQNVVNRSELTLTSASILEPRPESMILSMAASLKLPLTLPVSMNAITLELFNREQPMNNTWAKVYLPHTIIDGRTTLGVDNTPTLLDRDQWYEFVWKAVHLQHPPLSVRGSTTAFLGVLKNDITLNKDVPQTTFNGFAGFSISDATLLLPPREDGVNLIANATLPNPSVFSLELGNVTQNLYSGDLLIGNATLPDVYLKPGNHSTPVEGILDIRALLENLPQILEDQGPALKQGNLNLKAIGVSSVYKGIEIPYYTEVLKTLTLTAKVPIGGLVGNTFQGLVNSDDNPFANLSVSEPDSGDGSILDQLGGLQDIVGNSNMDKRGLVSLVEKFSSLE